MLPLRQSLKLHPAKAIKEKRVAKNDGNVLEARHGSQGKWGDSG
jgi:hypothetical protein